MEKSPARVTGKVRYQDKESSKVFCWDAPDSDFAGHPAGRMPAILKAE